MTDLESLAVEAVKLERGGIYALEYDGHLSDEAHKRVAEYAERIFESHGIRFILLVGGMRLAKWQEPAAQRAKATN